MPTRTRPPAPSAATCWLLLCAAVIVGLIGMHALTVTNDACHSETASASASDHHHGSAAHGGHSAAVAAPAAVVAAPHGEVITADGGAGSCAGLHHGLAGLCVAILAGLVVLLAITRWRRSPTVRRSTYRSVCRSGVWPEPVGISVVRQVVLRL